MDMAQEAALVTVLATPLESISTSMYIQVENTLSQCLKKLPRQNITSKARQHQIKTS